MTLADQIILALWTIAMITPRLRPYGVLFFIPAYYAEFLRAPWLFVGSASSFIALYISSDPLLSNQGLFVLNLLHWINTMSARSSKGCDCDPKKDSSTDK
jgi:hypothetical protein